MWSKRCPCLNIVTLYSIPVLRLIGMWFCVWLFLYLWVCVRVFVYFRFGIDYLENLLWLTNCLIKILKESLPKKIIF